MVKHNFFFFFLFFLKHILFWKMNEFLKTSNDSVAEAITKLLNDYLNLGVWNVSIVTALHKKGNIYDPNKTSFFDLSLSYL